MKTIKKKNPINKTLKRRSHSKIKIYILDYANIIYTLYEKYPSIDKLASLFVHFIQDQLKKGSTIIIVSKKVIIDNVKLDIQTLLSKRTYKPSKQLIIYNIEYKEKISSSTDDVLGWVLFLMYFIALSKLGIDPKNHLYMVTNDKQNFNKNLFGFTDDERKHNIRIMQDLHITTLNKNLQYVSFPEANKLKEFIAENVNTSANDTEQLLCNISLLTEVIIGEKANQNHETPHFKKDIFTRDRIPSFDYNVANSRQKRRLSESTKNKMVQNCKPFLRIREKGSDDLAENYYIYAWIKYMQMYLYNGDFFGSWTKEKILRLFQA